jgi:predicted small lipoprotein YifL
MNSIESRTQSSPASMVRVAALFACLVLFGASCGQRGPLYLPRSDSATGGPADVPSQQEEAAGSEMQEPVPEDDDGESDAATP